MEFIGAALAHVITWSYAAGFMAALFLGGCARLLWRIVR